MLIMKMSNNVGNAITGAKVRGPGPPLKKVWPFHFKESVPVTTLMTITL